MLRREVRATLRDPFTLGMLDRGAAGGAAAVRLHALDRGRRTCGLGVYDASQAAGEPPRDRRPRRRPATSLLHRATRRAHGDRARAWSAGEMSAALDHSARLRSRLLRRRRRRRQRRDPACSTTGAEAVLAGNAEALGIAARRTIAATHRRRARRAWRPGARRRRRVEVVVDARSSTRRLDGVPYMVAGTFGFVLTFLTTLLTAVSIVNERLSRHLRAAPGHAGDARSRSCSASCCRSGAVFAFDVVLMVLAPRAAAWTSGRTAARCSSSAISVVLRAASRWRSG